jgi:hypothetical protein
MAAQGRKKFVARILKNEDVDLAIRSEGTGEKVVVEEVLRVFAEDDAGSGHHATQRVPDHPYLARQLSGGDTWTYPQGGYPSGCRLIDGGSGPKSVGGSSRIYTGSDLRRVQPYVQFGGGIMRVIHP